MRPLPQLHQLQFPKNTGCGFPSVVAALGEPICIVPLGATPPTAVCSIG
jgi:hypothetical protein